MKIMIYIIIGIIFILIVLALSGKKSVHHEITIDASPETVWEILTDTDNYSEWNPTMELLEGDVKEGGNVMYLFTQDEENTSEISASVVEVNPPTLLNQKGGIPLFLTFNHTYKLDSDGSFTRVTIHEDYTGIWVNFWNPEPVGKAYKRLNEALKKKSESNNKIRR